MAPAAKSVVPMSAVAAAAAFAFSSNLFVAPSGLRSAPALTAAAASGPALEQALPSTSSSSASPLVQMSLAGAVAAAAAAGVQAASKGKAKRAEKASRRFFGGGGSTSSFRSFDPATEAGVQDPIGFWDPLGFSADKDEATFKRRRAVEIKHGRIAMYATLGYILPEYYKFPGDLSPSLGVKFADVPNGLAAFSKVPAAGWLQIFFFAGYIETTGFFSGKTAAIGQQQDATQGGEPGNYGVGFPNFLGKVTDPVARASKLNAELANGRLSMVAIVGMLFQDGLTGSAWGDWALYTASPLRAEPISAAVAAAAAAAAAKAAAAAGAAKAATGAVGAAKAAAATKGAVETGAVVSSGAGTAAAGKGREGGKDPSFYGPASTSDDDFSSSQVGEPAAWGRSTGQGNFDPSKQVGVTQPLGYFDPAGFCKAGDEAGFRNLRASEIKHGRAAMMASVGALLQHFVKFPGFEGVPSGLAAVATPPGTYGFAALFALSGALEVALWTEDPRREPGNFGDPLGLNQYTVDMREKELNNGRMAMFAAVGIIAGELLTGKDGIEQLGL